MFNNADTFQEDSFLTHFQTCNSIITVCLTPFFAAFQIIVVFKYPNELY